MANADDVQVLVNFGIFNAEGVSRLANIIRTIETLSSGGASVGVRRGRRRRPRKAQGAALNGRAAGARKRGPRAKFTATKEQLSSMRQSGMTAKAMAAKLGVSMATVNLHLRKHGLTKPRKGRAARAAKK